MLSKFHSKNAITGLVAVSLLMIVSVLSFMYLQGWFYTYKSDFEATISSKDYDRNLEVVKIDGTYIYVKNDFKEGLELKSITIQGKECILSNRTIDKGLKKIDIGGCISGFAHLSAYEVSITSDYGIKVEKELIRNIIDNSLIVNFQVEPCDLSSGYIRLYGLTGLDNAHADVDGSSTYNVCARHLDYTLGKSCSGIYSTVFYLGDVNNSQVWIDNSTAAPEPFAGYYDWQQLCLSSSGGTVSVDINSTAPNSNYVCAGSLDRDDYNGAAAGNCDVYSDKIWIKVE